jgi:hypothetical protein
MLAHYQPLYREVTGNILMESRVLKFTRGEVCIIDVGYIVNHCCFMLAIGVAWYIMGLKSCVD